MSTLFYNQINSYFRIHDNFVCIHRKLDLYFFNYSIFSILLNHIFRTQNYTIFLNKLNHQEFPNSIPLNKYRINSHQDLLFYQSSKYYRQFNMYYCYLRIHQSICNLLKYRYQENFYYHQNQNTKNKHLKYKFGILNHIHFPHKLQDYYLRYNLVYISINLNYNPIF